jgi:hypothetical protein
LIQSNFSPGKIARITGEKPTPQFYNKAFGKYDAQVEEGLNTSTQRQMQFKQLLGLRELGVPVPTNLLIEASTIQNKKELIEAIQQQEAQSAQLQQMKFQSDLQEQQAKVKDISARAEANAGLGLERASRVQENRALAVERLAEAQKERQMGALDKVKALKELQSMDLGQLDQLLAINERLKSMNEIQGEKEKLIVKEPNIEELAVAAQGEK